MSDEQSVIAALNSHDMWINPDDFDRAADEITCGGNEHMCEHARSDGGCYAEARGKYCPWIVAETLRGADLAHAGREPAQIQTSGRQPAIEIPDGFTWWAVEPDVGRVAHGIPARVDRLRSLGNAVLPQIPEILGHSILQAHGLKSASGTLNTNGESK